MSYLFNQIARNNKNIIGKFRFYPNIFVSIRNLSSLFMDYYYTSNYETLLRFNLLRISYGLRDPCGDKQICYTLYTEWHIKKAVLPSYA